MSCLSNLRIYNCFTIKCRCVGSMRNNLLKNNYRYFRTSHPCSWKILFFGNDIFSLACLKMLRSQEEAKVLSRLEVVTKASKGNPVMKYSLENKIPCHQWPYKSCDIIDFDLGAVVSFGYLIPTDIINKFPLGIVNVHASLLPRWRGASPISYAIMHGDKKTGVSIMRIKPHRFDVGDIISQAEVPVQPEDTFTSLLQTLSVTGASELVQCIKNLPQSVENAKPQGTAGVTYAPKITKEIAELDFDTMDATTIVARDRAISHVFPLMTSWWNVPAKLCGTCVSDYSSSSEILRPGQIYFDRGSKKVLVECLNRTFISFSKIVLRDHGPMSGLDFRNGFLSQKPEHQWKFKHKERRKSSVT